MTTLRFEKFTLVFKVNAYILLSNSNAVRLGGKPLIHKGGKP